MKKVALLFIIALVLGFGCAGNQNGSVQLKEGAAAPDFTAQDQAGNTVTLSKLSSQGPVVVSLLRGFS